MKLEALARHPRVIAAHLARPQQELTALHCDSRRVDPQTAFLALRGLRSDGHRFIDAALEAGTPALFVSDRERFAALRAAPPAGVAGVFLVDDGRAALAELSAELYGHPSRELALYGVTGTNGKTTTTHLVAQLLRGLGQSCAIIGTLGMKLGREAAASERTTPEAPEVQAFLRRCVARGVPAAAMEVSSIGIALERSRALRFRAAAFTNLSQDHLDFHAGWDAYREAKFRLFLEYDTPWAVINRDDVAGAALAGRLAAARRGGRVLGFGLESGAELTVRDVAVQGEAVEGRLCWQGASAPFRYGLLGRFNLYNLLAAVGLLLVDGQPLDALADAVEGCEGAPGRFERVPLPAPFTVLVDYAHSPDALENLLLTARPMARGRLAVLFGCGGDRDRAKRPLMGAVAERLADRIVLADDNPRGEAPLAILADIAGGMRGTRPTVTLADRRSAIYRLLDDAGPGDVLVIAGKGDETYQETAGVKRPFDDRSVVLDWGRERGLAAP